MNRRALGCVLAGMVLAGAHAEARQTPSGGLFQPHTFPIGISPVDFYRVEGDVVCDNYHAFYTARCEGAGMTLNKVGSSCTLASATSYDFLTTAKNFYLVAWSDDAIAQGLLHDLRLGGIPAFSGSRVWDVYPSGIDHDVCTPPSDAQIAAAITTATANDAWVPTVQTGPTNTAAGVLTYPWGVYPTIDPGARWTWYDSGNQVSPKAPFQGGYNHGEFLIFRARLTRVRGDVSCDNYHQVLTAGGPGGNLGFTHQGGGCSIAVPTQYDFLTLDRYLFIAAWSDTSVAQGLLHDLEANGTPLWSSSSLWRVTPSGTPVPGCVSLLPALIQNAAQSGTFVLPTLGNTNAAGYSWWGTIAGIAPFARWSWYDSGGSSSSFAPFYPGFDHGEFLVFRADLAQAAACALPATLAPDRTSASLERSPHQTLFLDAGTELAGAPFVLLGSASLDAGWGSARSGLSLVPDLYFTQALVSAASAAAPQAGFLDENGRGVVSLQLRRPAMAGLTLHHAYVAFGGSEPVISNSVPLHVTE